MNNITLIYALSDPRDGQIFYVGRTNRTLAWRLRGHLKDSKRGKSPKAKKIAQMLVNGVKPIIAEIARVENASLEKVEQVEQAWIDFLSFAYALLNTKPASAGGIGNGNGVRYNWTPDIIGRLGKEPDIDIAKDTGIGVNAVMDKRQGLGIPRFTEAKWTDEVIARMGKETDSAIAKSIGCAQSVVSKRRRQLGIPAPSRKKPRKPKPVTTPKRRIATNKVDVPQWVIDKLGTMPDGELAKLSGITHRVIWTRRQSLGIPSYSEKNGHPTRFGYNSKSN